MNPTDFEVQTGATNGQALPVIAPDAWQQIEQAYTEIQRRDGTAEQRAWRWERLALTLLGLLAATAHRYGSFGSVAAVAGPTPSALANSGAAR